jgi:subtilase family serine protease
MHISWISWQRPRPEMLRGQRTLRQRGTLVMTAAATLGLLTACAPGPAAGDTARTVSSGKPGGNSCLTPGAQPMCYTPGQYQVAYGAAALISKGIDGRGETIVMPELANTPTRGVTFADIRRALARFDRRFGLPAARLRVLNNIARSKTPPQRRLPPRLPRRDNR